jgi:hypothetical protein
VKRALWALCLAAGLSSCAGFEDAPLEHSDLGTFVVSEFRLPDGDHSAGPAAQRLLGQRFTFGPDRLIFPRDFRGQDCEHGGYRVTPMSANYIAPFDVGQAGTVSLKDADISDKELLEVWDDCQSGVFMSDDRSRMYIPGQGYLLLLQRD